MPEHVHLLVNEPQRGLQQNPSRCTQTRTFQVAFSLRKSHLALPHFEHCYSDSALLSRAVQAFKLSVTIRSRERPFWQAHYYDFNVSTHEKFVEKLRYIHRNPVRRGLAARPEDWKWSSFRHYQTGMRGIVEIESEWTARERGWQLPEWMRYSQLGSSSPVPKGEGPGAPST
jgi:REP element-mobilizing transposase RayT